MSDVTRSEERLISRKRAAKCIRMLTTQGKKLRSPGRPEIHDVREQDIAVRELVEKDEELQRISVKYGRVKRELDDLVERNRQLEEHLNQSLTASSLQISSPALSQLSTHEEETRFLSVLKLESQIQSIQLYLDAQDLHKDGYEMYKFVHAKKIEELESKLRTARRSLRQQNRERDALYAEQVSLTRGKLIRNWLIVILGLLLFVLL